MADNRTPLTDIFGDIKESGKNSLDDIFGAVKEPVSKAADIAASAISGFGRAIPETVEVLGASVATPIQMGINKLNGVRENVGETFSGLMAEKPLTPAINNAMGAPYEPQTDAGRYAKSAGAGAALGMFGGIGGIVSGIGGGIGSEAGGDIAAGAGGEGYRAVGNMVGGILGGVAPYRYVASPIGRALSKEGVPTPSADEIRALASTKYEAAAKAGGVFSPKVSNKFLAEATKGFEAPSALAAKAAKPAEALKYVEDFRVFADKPMTLADAQYLDEYLGDAVDGFVDAATGKVGKQGQKLLDVQNKLRETIVNAAETEVVGGRAGVEALKEGRELWARQAKLRDIEKIITRAELTQNPAQSLKTGFRTLYTNPSRMRGYDSGERELVRKAAESGRAQDLMQTLGSRLLPIITAASGGGVAGTLGAAAGASLSRAGASSAQMGRANKLVESVALGRTPSLTERARALFKNVGNEVIKQVKTDSQAVVKPLRINITNAKGK